MGDKGRYKTGTGIVIEDFNIITNEIKKAIKVGTEIVAVGCDGQRVKKKTVFVIGIAILNPDHHGGKFWTKKLIEKRRYSLPEKLYNEATIIVELLERLRRSGIDINKLEGHIDAGVNGKSSNYFRGMLGMIAGMGYKGKFKPDSWVANSICDKQSKTVKGA